MNKGILYAFALLLGLSPVIASDKGKEEAEGSNNIRTMIPAAGPTNLVTFANPAVQLPFDQGVRRLFLRFMDPQSAARFSATCKLLRNDYVRVLTLAHNNWMNGHATNEHGLTRPDAERRNEGLLLQLSAHGPSLVRLAEQAVAFPLLFPRRLEVAGAAEENTGTPTETEKALVEQIRNMHRAERILLEDFVMIAPRSPVVCNFLLKQALRMDPGKDFRFVYLMARLVQTDPALKKGLLESIQNLRKDYADWHNTNNLEAETIDPEMAIMDFDYGDGFIENLKTKTDLLKSALMAARILDFSGDPLHSDMLVNFNNELRDRMFKDDLAQYLITVPDQPLWACYANIPEALTEFCDVLSQMNDSGNYQKSLRNARALVDYLEHNFPSLTLERQRALCSDCLYQNYMGDAAAAIAAETKMLEATDGTQEGQVVSAVDTVLVTTAKISGILSKEPAVIANYEKVIQLLQSLIPTDVPGQEEERNEWAVAAPMAKMACLILLMGDESRFDDAEKALQLVEKAILAEEDLPEEEEIERPDNEALLYRPKLALALYRGHYATVLNTLKDVTVLKPYVFMAMKRAMNDPHMPQEVADGLGQVIAKSFAYLDEEDRQAGESSYDNKGTVLMMQVIFDEEFCQKYLNNQPDTLTKLKSIFERK